MKKKLSRWTAVFTVLLLCMGLCSGLPVSAAYENTHINSGNPRVDIVEIAKSQIGYLEGSLEGTVKGNNNYTKYNVWTTGSATALCPSATKVILPSSARTIPAFPVWKPQKYGERNRICRILISLILLASTDRCASTALRRPTSETLLWSRLSKVTPAS